MNKLPGMIVAVLLAGTKVVVAQAVLSAPSSTPSVPPPAFPKWNAPEPTPADAALPLVPQVEGASSPYEVAPEPDQVPATVVPSAPVNSAAERSAFEAPSSGQIKGSDAPASPPPAVAGCPCQQNHPVGASDVSSPVIPVTALYSYWNNGSAGTYETPVPPYTAGQHGRYPYYSYRRPWYTPGAVSQNVTIPW